MRLRQVACQECVRPAFAKSSRKMAARQIGMKKTAERCESTVQPDAMPRPAVRFKTGASSHATNRNRVRRKTDTAKVQYAQ